MKPRQHPKKTLVGFTIGDVRYAVHIDVVREITNPLGVVALPQAPPAVCGVADFRGEIVPVVDVRVRFGLPPQALTRRTKWIVIDVGGRLVALVVDTATEVFGTGGAPLRPAPPLGGGEAQRGIAGVVNLGDSLVFVLDTGPFASLTEHLVAQPPLLPLA